MAFDIDKYSKDLDALVGVTVPSAGDSDELGGALSELSRRFITLSKKYIKAKAIETKLRLAHTQTKADLDAAKARCRDEDEKYAECKNDKAREAYLDVKFAEEVADLNAVNLQHQNVKSAIELVYDAMSCLKFLKENVNSQVQLYKVDTELERAGS